MVTLVDAIVLSCRNVLESRDVCYGGHLRLYRVQYQQAAMDMRVAAAFAICIICAAQTSGVLSQQSGAATKQGTSSNAGASKQDPFVIVVGAGLAGAAAARDLVDAGIKNVLVLEARDRPGGRLYSVKTAAGPVDLGAMWIHEADDKNPLMNLAKKLKLPLSPTLDAFSAQTMQANGSPVDISEFMVVYMNLMNEDPVKKMREAEAAAFKAGKPGPKDEPFINVYNRWAASNKGTWTPVQTAVSRSLVNQGVQVLLNVNVTKASALRYGDAKTLPAVDVHVKPGFDAVPKALMPGLKVQYNTVVKSITQDANGVTVSTAKGGKLTADYVIVTVPLGVLKSGAITFNPPLPAAKQAAIKDMGMGVLDKLVLVFKPQDVFWDKKADFVSILPTDWSGKWATWLSYQRALDMPVLVGLNAADTAMGLEAKTDKEVVDDAMQFLTKAFGKKQLPRPQQAIVTRWGQDPLSRGSYSYYAVGNPKSITEVLAAPHNRVLFAGEATSKKMATALGALLSGQREAKRLVSMVKGPGAAAPKAATPKPAPTTNPVVITESGKLN